MEAYTLHLLGVVVPTSTPVGYAAVATGHDRISFTGALQVMNFAGGSRRRLPSPTLKP